MIPIRPIRLLRSLILLLFLLSAAGCAHFNDIAARADRPGLRADAYYHYTLGVLHNLAGEFEPALEEFDRALRHDPESPYLMTEKATTLLQMNDTRGAVTILEASLQRHPEYVDTHILLGRLYERAGAREKAISHYRTVIGLEPHMADPYLLLSLLYKTGGDYDQAIATLQELLERDPESYIAAYQLAHLYMETRQMKEARHWLHHTMKVKPSFDSALTDLALISEIEEDEERAIELYRDYLKSNPQDAEVRLRLGRLLLRRESYSDSAREFEEIIRVQPEFSEARFSLALSYLFGNRNIEEAAEIFGDLLEESPENDRIRYFLASSLQELKRSGEALDHFSRVDALSDLFAPSRIQMALILDHEGRAEEAIDSIYDAITLKADDPDLYRLLASLYEESGKPDRALMILKEALDAVPENPDIRYRIGLLYERTGHFEKAIAQVKEILEHDPLNAEAMNFIGYSYADRGINLDEAEKLITEALRLKPGSGHIIDSLGWVYFRQERISEAIQYLEEALSLLPDDPTIAEHLGDAYRAAGMIEKALETYGKALDNNPDNQELREKIDRLREQPKR
ncbi:MAG: tetratricopeptide repeat protein [Syntrophales bacterium]|jgi:tetratricopeptide (TPR) repeat protein|nr:tetratricopeptide repeat protein [Syntrophales bacterium]MCK9528876.1 tetratricopeptide repeat protein [Syntrophales bacterium]MDX9922960.1 tetratricopeptide repeat protein [Syntrophales bacterium]